MIFNHTWAMPSHETFSMAPIGVFVAKYLQKSTVSIDPFARNFAGATYTNDLNPDTLTSNHLDALDYLSGLRNDGIFADLIIFDPPYSPRQAKEVYKGIGAEFLKRDAQRVGRWFEEKNLVNDLLKNDGIFLHFGWHTNGMGKKRGYKVEEILLVNHGGAHNDTICMAERKLHHQEALELK